MRRVASFVFASVVLVSSPAFSQDCVNCSAVYYPGTVWSSVGTLSPAEKGNVIALTHVEQGVAIKGFEFFGQGTLGLDSKGFSWNNRVLGGIGGRFTQSIKRGMVRGSASWVQENRWQTNQTVSGWVLAAETWFGWNNTPRPAKVVR